jgi:hypothetical protein
MVIVGPYKTLQQLGRGGNARVFLARREEADEIVALKVLHPNADVERRARFSREVETLRALSGREGVLPLLNAEESDEPTWYAMPVAEPIDDALAGSSIAQVVEAVESIARTLTVLAADGYHHRDIKPGNLYRHDGMWAVGDFGLVDVPDASALTEPGRRFGPQNFVPYELVLHPDTAAGGPVDVYELAKTLWVLASGTQFAPLGHQIADGGAYSLDALLGVPRAADLDRVIDRATRTEPGQRPVMAQLAEELAAWLQLAQGDDAPSPGLEDLAAQLRRTFGDALSVGQLRELQLAHGRQRAAELTAALDEFAHELGRLLPGAVERKPYQHALETIVNPPDVDQREPGRFAGTNAIEIRLAHGEGQPYLAIGARAELRENGELELRAGACIDWPGVDALEGALVLERVEPADSVRASEAVVAVVAALRERAPEWLERLEEALRPRP